MGSSSSKPTPQTTMTKDFDEKKAYLDQKKAEATSKGSSSLVVDENAPEAVDLAVLNALDAKHEKDATFKLARLVLSQADPIAAIKSRDALIANEKIFNVDLKGTSDDKDKKDYPGPITNQASSGRCWLFATTNVLRYNVVEQLKLGDFELSQSYLYFYDKLEKANYYLQTMIELADEPVDGRLVSFLNTAPVNDGGQWDMAYNILHKYGMVPGKLYPESFSSASSARLNWIVTAKLREYGLELRKAARPADGSAHASAAALRTMKAQYMSEIYSTLCIMLGTPPKADEELVWEYYDKDKKFHSWKGTPVDFYTQFGKRKNMDPKDSFSLINDPRNKYEQLYSVKNLGNVWEGPGVKYVNAPAEVLEDAVIAGIKANTPLFFGCDVGKFSERAKGIMDTALYDLSAAFGYGYNLSKAERLIMGESSATHAMVITAVHVDAKGRPVRYKVENSWSKTAGEDGWFMMSADWFREYVYQVVVPRSIVDKKWVKVLDQEPLMLEPWDPMGALA